MRTGLFVLMLIFCAFSIKNAHTQLVFDINPDNLLLMQQGLGLPHSLQVARGHEALMRLRRDVPSSSVCTVTTPMGVTFDVNSPPESRFESWGDNCGIRVRNIATADEGRWRITATSGDVSFSGWIEVYVEDDRTSYTAPPISLHDGQTSANVELTTLDSKYCMVAQPASDSSLVPGHCKVTLDRITRAVKGYWNIFLGMPGKVNELHMQRQVTVEAERLDVGYIHDSNADKIHLYCNILLTEKNITFCRFQRRTAASGFNIADGLSDGLHSYYGEGFDQRHCGMTIEKPTEQDYGTWRCSVGVQARVGNLIEQQTPLQALISVSTSTRTSQRSADKTEIRTVFTQVDLEFSITCRADLALRYCWFQHPDGTQYTPLPLSDENQKFWYTGENLQAGDCGITFSHATEEDAGLWTCHMGPSEQVGIEVTDQLNVRVTGPLAANNQEIAATIGESVTLYCRTSNGVRPLDYCRFMTPNSVGLSVDETVTEEKEEIGEYDCMGKWRWNILLTGPLTASYQEIEDMIRESVTLCCRTSNGVRPLDYCRFMTPDYVGLSVDETVTEENAILNRFFFTPDRQLNLGDCSLNIKAVQHEDIGVWTCAGLVNGDSVEARDTVTVHLVSESHTARTLSQAGIFGMVIGLATLLAALGGVVWYKRHTLFPQRSNRSTEPTVAFNRRTLSSLASSESSNNSVSEVEIVSRGFPTTQITP